MSAASELEEEFKTDVETDNNEEKNWWPTDPNLLNQILSLNQIPVNTNITENDTVGLHSLLTKGEKIPIEDWP